MRECGYLEDKYGVQRMMDKFGAKEVVNAREPNWGHTCLHGATDPNIITLLIQNGAEVDSKDDEGATPLRWAIKYRSYSSITTLIKLGADLEKAKESNFWQSDFDSSMREEKTKDAIAEGQRLAGEKKK